MTCSRDTNNVAGVGACVAASATQLPSSSENPTVPKVTRIADERKRGIEEEQKSLRNGKGVEKSDELKQGMQKMNGEERASGDEKFELRLY